jgi:hypothetical protein
MSFFKLSDENIAATINNQYTKMKHFANLGRYDLALQAKENIKNYYNFFLMNHPEPFNLILPDSSRISCSDLLSREFIDKFISTRQ